MEAQAGWEHINLREIIFGKKLKTHRGQISAINGGKILLTCYNIPFPETTR
jgi:hypothetical protein